MTNPYLITDLRPCTINVSGGRSSGMMLHHILAAHGGTLPPNAHAVFCNTGKERSETLAFVAEMSQRWDVPIAWLEYYVNPDAAGGISDPKHCVKVVDFATASRNGEPFAAHIQQKQMLPNVKMRTCTEELKVQTVSRYLRRNLGIDPKQARRIVGFRYDEPRRWRPKLVDSEGCGMEFPMVYAKETRASVAAFWESAPFDLDLHMPHGSNCDLCMLKGKRALIELIRAEPSRADWWIAQERAVQSAAQKRNLRNAAHAQFSKRHSYEELVELAKHAPDPTLPFDDDTDCNCTD